MSRTKFVNGASYQQKSRGKAYFEAKCVIPIDQKILDSLVSDADDPFVREIKEDIEDLRQELAEYLISSVYSIATDKQMLCFNEYFIQGRTQREIAEITGLHQTSIHKHLHGNIIYKDNIPIQTHGGLIRKLQKFASEDQYALDLQSKIQRKLEELQ